MALPIQALTGLPFLGSSVFQHIRHIGSPMAGVLLCSSVFRCLMGQPLYCSAANAGVWEREGMVIAPHPRHDSAVSPCFHGCPAFPPQSPPHIPSIHLSAVNSSPRLGIAPQSLNSSSQPLHLPGDLHPCLGYVWLRQGLSGSHSI